MSDAIAYDPQLLKGALTLTVLRLLAEQESYGYELVVRIHELGITGVAEGSVYPVLARLERDHRVTARLVPSPAGPARKYYRPTKAGYAALAEASSAWRGLVEALDPLVSTPPPGEPASPATAPTTGSSTT